MDEKCARIWQKLSLALKPEVSADTFKRWFSSVELIQVSDDTLSFRVPNNIYQLWIESNYMSALQSAVVATLGAPREIRFSAAATNSGADIAEHQANADSEKEDATDSNRQGKTNASAVGL